MIIEDIHRVTKKLLKSPHSENFDIFSRLHPEIFGKILEKVKGKVLIDVGGGEADFILDLARKAKAKKYINVDLDYKKVGKDSEFAEYVKVSAEEFFSRKIIEDKLAVCLSGIDEVSYQGDFEGLAFLILQQLKKGDIVFGVNSKPFVDEISNSGLLEIYNDGTYFVFEKR
jgi:ubiquinone/menaquinone biosynthesis C-methylase UbiE